MAQVVCPNDVDLLPFALGQPLSNEVRRHVNDCSRCRERLEQLRREKAGTSGNDEASEDSPIQTLPDVAPPPAAAFRDPAPAPACSTPTAIGKYRIVRALDKGGQALVYLALHPTLHKEVAIKWSRWPVSSDPDDRTGLLREGRVLADLEAPGLARIYDLDFEQDRPFLVMEFIRGRNLLQYGEQERPTPRRIAVLLAQLARALDVAHARGIIHQDIKPQNIIIDEAGQPYLIDFGLAKLRHAWEEDPDSSLVTGTPAFMAPEQARGENDRVGSRSDIFALGGVLYFLLTGKPPFDGPTLTAALQRAAHCDWDREALRVAGAPRPLARLCEHALAANPEDRPASARRLAERLEAFAHRPRRLALLAAFVLVLMLSGFAWWSYPWAAPAATAGEPSLEVQVWRGEQSYRLLDALPLRSGDELQVLGQVPPGLQPALFWFDSEGRLHEMPLEASAASEGTRFRYPPRPKAVKLKGPPGTEVLLVCARRSGSVEVEEIRRLFADRAWPSLPAHALLVLDRRQVRMLGSRAPGQLTDRPASGIVERAEALRSQLAARVDVVVAIAFPHHP